MDIQKLNPECIICLLDKYLARYSDQPDDIRVRYMQRILKILSEAPLNVGAPEIVDEIQKVEKEMFGFVEDFTEIKKYFNNLLMEFEEDMQTELASSDDSLRLAVCYAMTGNYIDFGAMKNVDETKLRDLIAEAKSLKVDEKELSLLKSELSTAKSLVFLTDNCGEIVFDKQLVSVIRKMNPGIDVTVIVRGMPVLNDATLDDAYQVGFQDIATVLDNGSAVAGTCLDRISDAARGLIDKADVIIAKGQGNFETLRFCGKNIYYLFMCKCKMFADRFNVPRYSGMLINDLRMKG